MSILADCIVNLGLAVVKDKITDSKEHYEINKRLHEFIFRQSKINEFYTIAEEIDFHGLSEYITSELLDDVKMRLFGNRKDREIARETTISKAVMYSQARTEISRKRVARLIATIIDILRDFYREKVNRNALLIAAEIEDELSKDIKEQISEQNKKLTTIVSSTGEYIVDKVSAKLVEIVDKVSAKLVEIDNQNFMSVDRNLQLIKCGKLDEVESNITSFVKSIFSEHILFPEYGYDLKYKGGKAQFFSTPLLKKETIIHPPKIKCIGTIKLGDQQLNELNANIVNYANRHQLPITIHIQEAQKLLGNIVDPIQHEAEEIVGTELVIPPKPFPVAFPCSISLNGIIEFKYILFRTQEIQDDITIIISNREQKDCPFRLSMKINLTEKRTDFSICIENPSNSDLLHYVRFMKKVSSGATISIKVLSSGINIIEGHLNQFEYKSGFDTIEHEIDFLEKIIAIEKHFGKPLIIPNEILVDDHETIFYMASLIDGIDYYGSWSSAEFSFELTDILKGKIYEMTDSQYSISYNGSIDLQLYGELYQLSILRTFMIVQVKNLEKLRRKSEVLDIGDLIKIEYLPGEKDGIGSYVDVIYKENSKPLEK